MGYREYAPTTALADLVEVAWTMEGPPAPVRVLPDGCMDLIAMDNGIVVAGPDTAPVMTTRDEDPYVGLRFRPGILPRLLGVPGGEIRDTRVPLSDLRRLPRARSLTELTEQLRPRPRAAKPHRGRCRSSVRSPAASPADPVSPMSRRPSAGHRAPCSAIAPPSTATVLRRCDASCGSVMPGVSLMRGCPSPTSPPARATPINRTCTARSAR